MSNKAWDDPVLLDVIQAVSCDGCGGNFEGKHVEAIYDAGYTAGRAAERAAVVEWLRAESRRRAGDGKVIGTLEYLADDIEAGEHLPGKPGADE
jgi:hypothetical protein